MKIYVVKVNLGGFRERTYQEVVQVIEAEEKPKTYIGKGGSRYSKDAVGIVRNDYGNYKMLVLSEDDIPKAREEIYAKIEQALIRNYEEAKADKALLSHFNIENPIKYI